MKLSSLGDHLSSQSMEQLNKNNLGKPSIMSEKEKYERAKAIDAENEYVGKPKTRPRGKSNDFWRNAHSQSKKEEEEKEKKQETVNNDWNE